MTDGRRRTQDCSAAAIEHWDVIGIADIDEVPEREYVHEARHLLRALNAGAGESNITNLLAELGRDVNAPQNRARDTRAARAVKRRLNQRRRLRVAGDQKIRGSRPRCRRRLRNVTGAGGTTSDLPGEVLVEAVSWRASYAAVVAQPPHQLN